MIPSRLSLVTAALVVCNVSAFSPAATCATGLRRTAPLQMSSGANSNIGEGNVSRRTLFAKTASAAAFAVAAATGSNPGAAFAASNSPPTAEELNRIKVGYEGIQYLLDNFEKETTVCRENGGECKRDADAVRKYLGLRSTSDPLFQIEKVFNKVKYMDIDPDKLDAFFEASENWNSAMNMSNSMAFISQFGEYNPGGGKDEVLKYLNEAQKQVVLAEKSLKIIMECLDIA
mmetsp:Transcript_27993/g.52112  ORF Transcript_27993/g.52112 Transcript_27993/m.52112 type:complete len:231 (-) Transcript_27993:354-1046(-)